MRTSSEPLSHLDKPVIQLRIHKYFDNITKEFDIALIKFDEEGIEFQVSFSHDNSGKASISQPHIVPICLPPSHTDLTAGRAWVTGWGKLHKQRRLMSDSLRMVEVPIISNIVCEKFFRSDLTFKVNTKGGRRV